MATSPGTDAASSPPYHKYPAAPVLSPDHGPPAYPGDATEVSAVEVQVELPSADRDEEELGTNGEVSKDFVCNYTFGTHYQLVLYVYITLRRL